MKSIGPQAPPGLAAPSEHLPTNEHAVLKGHEGPVLAVRFNRQGTYCLSCGKVRQAGVVRGRGGGSTLCARPCGRARGIAAEQHSQHGFSLPRNWRPTPPVTGPHRAAVEPAPWGAHQDIHWARL